MKTAEAGLALIKRFEGFVPFSYQDAVKVWTIGYGTIKYPNGARVAEGQTCTKEQANIFLKSDLSKFEKEINALVKVKITQNQFDALASFTYNLGSANLASSTLLKKLNINANDKTIATEFVKWNKAGGNVLRGLTVRREAEAELYFKQS